MSVDAGITCCASEVLVLPIRNVLMRLGIAILLGQTKIDNVDLICLLAKTHQKVVRLDVTMDERLGVDVLDAAEHLFSKHQDRLERKFARTEVEKVF